MKGHFLFKTQELNDENVRAREKFSKKSLKPYREETQQS